MVTNVKKVTGIEEVQKLISIELYKPCIATHQELEISLTLMPKRTKFLRRLYIDIEKLLLVTYSDF